MADPAKTEQATPRRKQEARKRGQIARSTELTAALVLLAMLMWFKYFGLDMLTAMAAEARHYWGNLRGTDFTVETAMAGGSALIFRGILILAPLLLLLMFVGILSNIAQFGILFTTTPIEPKFDHLNPASGFKRIFALRTAVDMTKAIFKVALVTWVAWSVISSSFQDMLMQSVRPVNVSAAAAGAMAFSLGIKVVLALLAMAILDYLYQRWEYDRSLRMTRQEVRDEYRQLEGDPMVKARIRQLQREASRRRMITEIPKADVVITNPMHLAVVIKYDPGKSRAPQVIAKGARLLAERIKEVARTSHVPIYEDPPLAQSLFAVPVGGELPAALYHGVAQVLAFVYHANRKDKERAAMKDVAEGRVKVAMHHG
jgi:flagellar biosynthetic protein FlhB